VSDGCEVRFSEGLWPDFLRVPKSVGKKLPEVRRRLSTDPRGGSNVRRLRGWRGLYRYRMGDHRLIYAVESEQSRCVVTLLYLGHRKDVYRRLGHDPDRDAPTVLVAKRAPHLVARPEEQTGRADEPGIGGDERPGIDLPLPDRFHEVLDRLGISGEGLTSLQECRTESQLLSCGVSQGLLERTIYALWPRSIDRVVNEPKRVVDSPQGLEEAVGGTRPLESFLLARDQSQRRVVESFTRRPAGPRIVKGGPGTGKSTVALYCLRSLVSPAQTGLPFSPPRILFTTYTRALVSTTRHLLGELGVDWESVDVLNVDSLARHHAKSSWANASYRASDRVWRDTVEAVLPVLKHEVAGFSFTEEDSEFLFDEMNQVVVGRGIGSLDQYLGIERVGRGRRIGRRQRRHVWRFAAAASRELRNRERCLRAHLFVDAERHAGRIYDHVFIDEAQDLPPVAIRMCVKLAKDGRNVFLTADRNQSIYTSGFSWKEVQASLDMRGRSTILRCNHRTTREIMDAIRPLLVHYERVDLETWEDTVPVRSGPRPELRYASGDEVRIVSRWLIQVVAEEPGLDMAHTAVLCPTNKDCRNVAGGLEASGLRARHMTGDSVDLRYDGIKVMTMHSAKGLQFPIVAVVGLEEGKLPFTDANNPEQREDTDQRRRVFFVACSRAMRRLLVVADKARPSPFVADFDDEHWTIA